MRHARLLSPSRGPVIRLGGGWPCLALQDRYRGRPAQGLGPDFAGLIRATRESRLWWLAQVDTQDAAWSSPVDVDRDTSPTDGVEAGDTALALVTPLGWPATGAVAYPGGWVKCRFAHGVALVSSQVGVWADVADAIWDASLSFPQDHDCDADAEPEYVW